jgi:hypothetical protein
VLVLDATGPGERTRRSCCLEFFYHSLLEQLCTFLQLLALTVLCVIMPRFESTTTPHLAPQIALHASSLRASCRYLSSGACAFREPLQARRYLQAFRRWFRRRRWTSPPTDYSLSLAAALTSPPVARPTVFTSRTCVVSYRTFAAWVARAGVGIQRFPRAMLPRTLRTASRRAHAACQHDSQAHVELAAVQYRRKRHDVSLGSHQALFLLSETRPRLVSYRR